MKKLIIAYLGGMLASIPAYLMFNQVGASPFRNLDAVSGARGDSLTSILIYFALLWIVPAFGSAFGSKIGGSPFAFRYSYGRGVGGQVAFSIGFSLVMLFAASVEAAVTGLATGMQTIVFLLISQVGCTLGTVWGL